MSKRRKPSDSQSSKVLNLPALAVFARAAIPGKTKTRLIPALGRAGAATFHRALVADTLRKVARLKGRIVRYLFVADGIIPRSITHPDFEFERQRGRDLGERLDHAFALLLRKHPQALIIGTDSPAVSAAMLRVALEELRLVDAVLGPCPDGGYYLIGLRRTARGLFRDARLGSEFAFRDTIEGLIAHGLSCSVLEPCPDIDRPEDLRKLRRELINNPSARRLMPSTWRFLSQQIAGKLLPKKSGRKTRS